MIQEFVAKILEVLSPMPDVTAIKSKDHIVLYKDGVMFGKIFEQSVLLSQIWEKNPALAVRRFNI